MPTSDYMINDKTKIFLLVTKKAEKRVEKITILPLTSRLSEK